ncbi:Respiratory supercomplex factor 1, mitochondrial [Cladophialophora chaetospira]|uniref:Respiratory supercomplex factor 1, mitochondrial n=1 Tax=Cladophialophora chaetospira TaxID=386627 RepID=A0AA38X1Y3_9EURO|nr:Respiratory supercomplex factor 1, mitochondrial [Cladophialophora chaetospira]
MSDEHGPSPLSSSQIPSSFDATPEFFEESRFQKLWRKIRQEPLIPVGCAATCYALYMATKSIRAGDHHQTNRMFRARIYAQGFTLIALVAGSIFYKDERMKRKSFEQKLEEKKLAEKRDKWLAELEARDQEDKEWRRRIESASFAARDAGEEVKEKAGRLLEDGKESLKDFEEQVPQPGDVRVREEKKKGGWLFSNKSVLEEVYRDGWGPGMWAMRTRDAWRRC